jgi:hypothetical protein
MLLEALTYLITPCPPVARRLGFAREMVSIISRHGRCRAAWAPHLERSRALVRRAAENAAGRRRAVIFGAGLGYDLPLEDLAHRFEEVFLVDLVFGPAIRLSAWRNRRVHLVSHDVTECLEDLVNGLREPVEPTRFLDDPAVDLVVSLNIASQLPTLPGLFLEDRADCDEAAVDAIGRSLIEAHCRYLAKFNCAVCVVADLEREILAPDGSVIETVSALRGARLPWTGETWTWDIAPLGEEGPGYAVRNRVLGVENISEAPPVA